MCPCVVYLHCQAVPKLFKPPTADVTPRALKSALAKTIVLALLPEPRWATAVANVVFAGLAVALACKRLAYALYEE